MMSSIPSDLLEDAKAAGFLHDDHEIVNTGLYIILAKFASLRDARAKSSVGSDDLKGACQKLIEVFDSGNKTLLGTAIGDIRFVLKYKADANKQAQPKFYARKGEVAISTPYLMITAQNIKDDVYDTPLYTELPQPTNATNALGMAAGVVRDAENMWGDDFTKKYGDITAEQAIRNLITTQPTLSVDELKSLLERAQNGLRWYQDAHPEDESPADDELHEAIDNVLNVKGDSNGVL